MPNVVHVGNLPVFTASSPALWIIGSCGTVLSASGEGWSRVGADPDEMIGRSLWEWAGDREDVRRMVAVVLTGGSHDGTLEYGGVLWRVSLRPLRHPETGVVGCACTAYPIERQGDPAPAGETWVAAGDNSRYHIWSADEFDVSEDDQTVTLRRRIPHAYWQEARNSAPERMHLIRSSARPASPARLRLMP